MKKKIQIAILLIMFSALASNAQILEPVKWNFSAKKITENIYEIHLAATMEKGWHIYSQDSPDKGPLPTQIRFEKKRSLILTGKAKETGKPETEYLKIFNINVKYYSEKVEFVQIIRFNNKVPKRISGTVEYMACKGEQCLPPTEEEFNIDLESVNK